MKIENFFTKDPSDLTRYKIFFYEKYVETWLIKLLMTKGACFIGDLFCGPGMNGTQEGSPLVLLKGAENMLTSAALKRKFPNPHIAILFNDGDSENAKKLNQTLGLENFNKFIRIIGPQAKSFDEIMDAIKKEFRSDPSFPKFFFLDPFNYSSVSMDNLKMLISYKNTEVMLFLPAFHAYRFSKTEREKCPKLDQFLKEFTLDDSYGNMISFVDSIKNKIEKESGAIVRPIIIDGGSSKNCLLLITKNITGLDAMNNLVWKTSGEKWIINVKKMKGGPTGYQTSLFPDKEIESAAVSEIKTLVYDFLKPKLRSNMEIIKFCVLNNFRLTDMNKAMKILCTDNVVEVTYTQITAKKSCFYLTIKDRDNPKALFAQVHIHRVHIDTMIVGGVYERKSWNFN